MPEGDRLPSGRHETREQRADRLWAELLQEVRVAQTGVQILLGFLLAIAFTPRFAQLGAFDQGVYVTTVLLGAATTGALIAPVSFHRILTGRSLKPETVQWAARLTMAGLVLLLCTVMSALLLILRLVVSDGLAVGLVLVTLMWFAGCWFAPALWLRHKARRGS
jgi:hypothetical protein